MHSLLTLLCTLVPLPYVLLYGACVTHVAGDLMTTEPARYNRSVTFTEKATFNFDAVFMENVVFNQEVTFNGNATFHADAVFKGYKTVFNGRSTSFEGRVQFKGYDLYVMGSETNFLGNALLHSYQTFFDGEVVNFNSNSQILGYMTVFSGHEVRFRNVTFGGYVVAFVGDEVHFDGPFHSKNFLSSFLAHAVEFSRTADHDDFVTILAGGRSIFRRSVEFSSDITAILGVSTEIRAQHLFNTPQRDRYDTIINENVVFNRSLYGGSYIPYGTYSLRKLRASREYPGPTFISVNIHMSHNTIFRDDVVFMGSVTANSSVTFLGDAVFHGNVILYGDVTVFKGRSVSFHKDVKFKSTMTLLYVSTAYFSGKAAFLGYVADVSASMVMFQGDVLYDNFIIKMNAMRSDYMGSVTCRSHFTQMLGDSASFNGQFSLFGHVTLINAVLNVNGPVETGGFAILWNGESCYTKPATIFRTDLVLFNCTTLHVSEDHSGLAMIRVQNANFLQSITFDDDVEFDGDITFHGDATFRGDVVFDGPVTFFGRTKFYRNVVFDGVAIFHECNVCYGVATYTGSKVDMSSQNCILR